MKYLDEYRDGDKVKAQLKALQERLTRPWQVMEVCGGQTHNFLKSGLDGLLPEGITLVHGPGCPVCVTPIELIDKAIALARQPQVIFCSFGDMLRVPGSKEDLLSAKSQGAEVRMVYSPLDALKIAEANPEHKVVFFAIGFETTAPMNAMAALQAKQRGVNNFYLLAANMLVPPAIAAILSARDCQVKGFLAPGHVCTVSGYVEYEEIAKQWWVPIVVTGFEPLDLIQGLYMLITQLETGSWKVENQYRRSATRQGNLAAKALMEQVFSVCDRKWRGLGPIPASGYCLKPEYADLDAEKVFQIEDITAEEPKECIAGLVLQGRKKPTECAAFGKKCTPQHPLGAPMVSSEGACAAYYQYGIKLRTS
ncbi:MAG: hydrogenase formation protein HypD [Armatimonadetes bacterium]|nr:hydrogenase formation protein HypD [Armatimonadota bacterium]NIM24302.1 hydrogenase formation protein HypD [Armatimonadota bacterium]NIM68171.1 hydrogenase formation protein HypD [Armatimonadota bacterium]NIM76631.1 hydrogenase formation protein HypD [Armatimonadota bacterium]NIN06376.1 hydrogenase formation protein HypD [Armatimonadota bacterium]